MEHGGMPAATPAARLTGRLGRRRRGLGRGVVLAAVAGVVFLAIAAAATWMGESSTVTRITLTMPCARVDAATVGHSAYGLDQVLSASCTPVTAHH